MPPSPDFTVHQLRIFVAVAQHGSFSRAAIALDIPQPSISRLVGRIERLVGMKLMLRSGHGVSLSPAGKRFLEHARKILHCYELAYSDLQGMQGKLVGEVRIAAPESISNMLFAPLVTQFKAKFPHAIMRTIAAQSASIPAMLDNDTVDIGIIADTHPHPSRSLEMLFREDFYLVGRAGVPEVAKSEIGLADVAELPLILNAMPGGFRSVIDAAFASQHLTPNVMIEIDANTPLLELLLDGEGFSILPFSLVCKNLGSANFMASKIVEPVVSRHLSILMAGRPATPVWQEAARQIRIIVKVKAKEARWIVP